ncbi:putative bifunctional diguanylate cyclase/phosphodiesterase [Hyphomonas atlantica corrig.]|uniref:putative bifunctional diguanylate cyclase/phosphodiesterase n=1 Tax=Hyphomonas atlantica TaxID=1280948 RepID=UPI002357FBA9|nr:EAL domain-containing protein [Hyphomonas atlantica]
MQRISDIKHYRAMLHNARSMDEAVMMEQIRATTQNLPALYVMLCVAAFSLGLCFLEAAPLYLTLGIPAFFIVGSILRISHWQMSQADFTDPDKAKRDFRAMEIGSVTIFIVLGGWICLLFPYAEGARETQLALFTGLIGPVGMMCSMPRPRIVAIGLIGTLFVFSALFVLAHPASYSFIVVPMAVSYLVFFKVSYAHKQRIVESVNLHSELVSENERASGLAESNRFLALSDTLTGLPNRRRFFEQINLFFDRCPDGEMPIVGLVDLDGFKPLNDVFGHSAGDAVLVETAARLKTAVARWGGVVARLGGDEFAYVLPWDMCRKDVLDFSEELVKQVGHPVILPSGDTSRVSASIGLSSRGFEVASAKDLLEQADFALFRAKEQAAGAVVEFSSRHAESKRREVLVHQAFKNARLDREIHLVFQPIIDTHDGTISRCEALARWDSPEIGMVPPGEFVPIAEKAGMTQEMTLAVFRKVIAQLKVWPDNACIAVNLSAQDVNSRQCTDLMASMLIRQPPSLRKRISIEVTETSLLTDFTEVHKNLMKFRELGVKIALDDFGTGFSSLRYLQELEFDIVKIDRSFVSSIESNDKSFGLVRTISRLCRSLSIACVAEGVETREELEHVRAAGCHLVQGFYFSTPLTAEKMLPYLTGEESFEGMGTLVPVPRRDVA